MLGMLNPARIFIFARRKLSPAPNSPNFTEVPAYTVKSLPLSSAQYRPPMMSGTLNADKNRLYQVLEVTPDASDAEIKKAYNKLTMKWHNQNAHNSEAANTLKEIRHAYEVLTDPHKRQVYSQYGDDRQGRGGDWMSAEDVVSQLFSEMSDGMFSGRGIGGGKLCGRGLTQQVPKRSRDIVNRVKVPLEDIYKGKATKLTIQKNVICPKCEGRGAKEGAINKCTGCNGAREKTVMRQIGLVLQRVHISCSECNGKGGVVGNKDMCKHCNGSKVVTERKTLRFHVDKGVKDGTRIVFHGEGNQAPDIIPGDVVFVITTKPHLRFQRKDDDLFYYAEIDLLTALAGGRVGIQHLDRRWLSITIKPGEVISPGQVKAIIGQGMPSYRHHGNGNLYIHFNIKFPPNSFNDTEKLLALEHILPPRMPSGLPTGPLSVGNHVRPRQKTRGTGNGNANGGVEPRAQDTKATVVSPHLSDAESGSCGKG